MSRLLLLLLVPLLFAFNSLQASNCLRAMNNCLSDGGDYSSCLMKKQSCDIGAFSSEGNRIDDAMQRFNQCHAQCVSDRKYCVLDAEGDERSVDRCYDISSICSDDCDRFLN